MNRRIFKSILGGIVLGTILFFAGPVLLFFLFAVLTLKFIFTPFGWGRMMMYRGAWGHPGMGGMGAAPFAFANKVRNMSDTEFAEFQDKMKNRFSGRCHHYYHDEQANQPS
ncbi:MAG: hypothetical protein IPP69_12150 [Flavobacteriales bacterium]|nr:hypothetical protein [Flavobacteriales bacterium]